MLILSDRPPGRDQEVDRTEEIQVNLQYACGNQEIGVTNPSHKKKQRLVTKTLHTPPSILV